MTFRIQCFDFDAANPQIIATFWEHALGWRRTYDSPTEVILELPVGSPEVRPVIDLIFLKVPEEKKAKNRIHIDLRPDDRDAEVARLEGLGAKRVEIGQTRDESWVVLADPEENEFCVLRTLAPGESNYEGDGLTPY